jgi:2-C-methyl-D-erythritol 4-phosphate cytidylyltransferase
VPVAAILAAAGRGLRLGAGPPKALRPLAGRPLFLYSLEALLAAGVHDGVIVAPAECVAEFTEARDQLGGAGQGFLVVPGGEERQDSVACGIAHLSPQADLILVHDAARPFVRPAAIKACIRAARQTGAAILAVPVTDTIKWVEDGVVRLTIDRTHLWRAQTPQVSRRSWIEEAFTRARAAGTRATDEASLLEAAGFPVQIVPGDEENRKLTAPADWEWAEWYVSCRLQPAAGKRA